MQYSIIKTVRKRIPSGKINLLMKVIRKQEKPVRSYMTFIFFRDSDIRELNKAFRGIDKATDVLSFNYDDPPVDDSFLGEIYISIESAARNAEADKVSFDEMILRLCCHGVLHLLGYDHKRRSDRLKMEKRERDILNRVGID